MVGLVENVSEITIKVTNYHGKSLASDEVCSERTGINAEKYMLKSLTAITSASPKAVVLASMLC